MSATAPSIPSYELSDDQAFSLLMSKWNSHLYSFAWHYLRDSKMAREVVVRVLVSYHLQNPGFGSASVWLYTRLADSCKKLVRKARPEPEPDMEVYILVQAIASLRHDLKVAFLAQQCTPLSLDEIAEILNATPDEARHLIHRARQTLVTMVTQPTREAASPIFASEPVSVRS